MTLAPDQPLLNIILIAVGLFILLKGSDWFVDSAVFIARKFDVSEMIIGLTLVSIGTSLPELAANVYASFMGETEVALGNVVGSNITNISLILGVGAIYASKLQIPKTLLNRDSLVLLLIYFFFIYLCFFDGFNISYTLTRIEGIVLLFLFGLYLFFLFKSKDIVPNEESDEHQHHLINSVFFALLFFIIGFVMITFGAKLAVDNVVNIANSLKISKEIISGTIIAFGTSIPELAVTIVSIKRGRNNLALGNIIGSCIFNVILVMGVAIVIQPVGVSLEMRNFLLPIMLFSGALMVLFMRSGLKLVRWEGMVLTFLYLIYIIYNLKQILF